MSSYIVIKTINGRQYRYRQSTWREGGRMRTKSQYLGPVGGDLSPVRERKRGSGVTEFVKDLVRKRECRDDIEETQAEARERVAREDMERTKNDRVNELLTADTISLGAIGEIADMQAGEQSEGESEDSPGESAE